MSKKYVNKSFFCYCIFFVSNVPQSPRLFNINLATLSNLVFLRVTIQHENVVDYLVSRNYCIAKEGSNVK